MCGDGNPCITPAKKRKPDMSGGDNSVKAKANHLLLFIYYFSIFSLLLNCGCNRQQKPAVDLYGDAPKKPAVDLYVDAVMLKELGQNELAIERLNSAIKLEKHPSLQAPAYSLLGEIYLERKDYDKSAASYEKAIQQNPWSFNDLLNLGKIYQLMKDFSPAAQAYTTACDIDRGHLEAHINAAKCYREIWDYGKALKYGQRAEQIDPNSSETHNFLGDLYTLKKDHAQAIRSYKRCLEIDSDNPAVMIPLAVEYLRTNRNEPARDVLESTVKIQPGNGTAYKHLGYCYLRLKEKNKAIVNYNKAIGINENDWDARRGLGVAYILKGTNEDGTIDEQLKAEAVRQWQRSLDIKPNQPNRESLLKYIRVFSR